jgi:2-polyprenyl-3-methyl-5-hydroxy-6-metoxy-1,4-benzoquinol methylase
VDAKERERLEALNTDHHRRMSVMHVGHSADQLKWFDDRNIISRELIVSAMLGCQHRAQMKLDEKRQVLELGAGHGNDRGYLCSRLDASYVGVEVVKHAAEAAGVLHMAVEEIPHDLDGKFQFVYSRHVMEHVVNLDLALAGIVRALAPNGIVGAVTPHVFPDREPAHVCLQTISEWCDHYRRHGLRPVYAKLESLACEEAHIVCIREEWASRVLGKE